MNKYNAKKCAVYGKRFDSQKEAARWLALLAMEQNGAIRHLQRQVRYELIPAQYIDGKCVERAVNYVADFVYRQDGKLVVEDVKGMRTDAYILKRKLMLFRHGIRVKEV